MIRLHRLLLIADGFAAGRKGRDVGAVWVAVDYAIRHANLECLVMLRDHEATAHEFEVATDMLARQLCGPLRRRPFIAEGDKGGTADYRFGSTGIELIVNTRTAVAEAERTGLHVGAQGPAVASVAGRFPLVGYSAHTPEEAGQAARDGADYATFSPIFPTSSKPGHSGVGLDKLAEATRAAHPVPVYALGGITPGRVKACLEAGAHGVAVLSGILDAPNPVAAAADYQAALESYA
jgi:thiamine-phosphate pyrophosphorylase